MHHITHPQEVTVHNMEGVTHSTLNSFGLGISSKRGPWFRSFPLYRTPNTWFADQQANANPTHLRISKHKSHVRMTHVSHRPKQTQRSPSSSLPKHDNAPHSSPSPPLQHSPSSTSPRDAAQPPEQIDWTLILNVHDTLDLDISECWNCGAALHASRLFECPECLLPN
jgi:hypothetical protein